MVWGRWECKFDSPIMPQPSCGWKTKELYSLGGLDCEVCELTYAKAISNHFLPIALCRREKFGRWKVEWSSSGATNRADFFAAQTIYSWSLLVPFMSGYCTEWNSSKIWSPVGLFFSFNRRHIHSTKSIVKFRYKEVDYLHCHQFFFEML